MKKHTKKPTKPAPSPVPRRVSSKPAPHRAPAGRPRSTVSVAETLEQAVALLRDRGLTLPKSALQWAKGEACPAFHAHRVHLEEFEDWWSANGSRLQDDSALPLEDVLDRQLKLQRLNREIREDEIAARKFTLTAEVTAALAAISAEQQSALLSLPRELPPVLLDQDAAGMQQVIQAAVCRIIEIFQTGVVKFQTPAEWFYEI